MTDIISSILAIIEGSSGAIMLFVKAYGYLALFILMTLGSASLPIASEVVIPLAGVFSAQGILNIYLVFIVIFIANVLGLAIDYAIGYYLGKDVIYRHLSFFRIKKSSLDAFDEWFARNGAFAVFISRFIPEVRALMSFPAGFAKMPLKKFFFWSILGCLIWEIVLLLFGYYLLSVRSISFVLGAIAVFVIILYLIYVYAMRRIRKNKQ